MSQNKFQAWQIADRIHTVNVLVELSPLHSEFTGSVVWRVCHIASETLELDIAVTMLPWRVTL